VDGGYVVVVYNVVQGVSPHLLSLLLLKAFKNSLDILLSGQSFLLWCCWEFSLSYCVRHFLTAPLIFLFLFLKSMLMDNRNILSANMLSIANANPSTNFFYTYSRLILQSSVSITGRSTLRRGFSPKFCQVMGCTERQFSHCPYYLPRNGEILNKNSF